MLSNMIRNTSHRFQMEMQMEYSLKKMHAFLPDGILHRIRNAVFFDPNFQMHSI